MARPKPAETLLGKAHAIETQRRFERMDSKVMLWAAYVGLLNELRAQERKRAFDIIDKLKRDYAYDHPIDATMRRLVVGEDG